MASSRPWNRLGQPPATRDVSLGGGADVAQQYLAAGLLDEIVVSIVPLTLGSGARLFDNLGATMPALEQVEAIEAPGVTHIRYARVAEPRSGPRPHDGLGRLPPAPRWNADGMDRVRTAWEVLRSAVREARDDDVATMAQALAYALFLAIPATALVVLGVFSLVADPESVTRVVDAAP